MENFIDMLELTLYSFLGFFTSFQSSVAPHLVLLHTKITSNSANAV